MLRIAALITLLTSSLAHAVIINGSFESGMLGWNQLGPSGAVAGAVGSHNPTDGSFQAGLETDVRSSSFSRDVVDFSYGPPGTQLNDEAFSPELGLPLLEVSNPFFGTTPTEPETVTTTLFELARQDTRPGFESYGPLERCYSTFFVDECFTNESSAIAQNFEAKAGGIVAFDWNFISGEADSVRSITDAAFVSISTASFSKVFLLQDSKNNGLASFDLSIDTNYDLFGGGPYNFTTGYQSFSFKIPESGIATLGFSVFNSSDSATSSALLIDNVRTIPEPGTLGLLCLGILGLSFIRRPGR